MKGRLILLDLLLLAGIGYLGLRLRQTWQDARERESVLLAKTVKPAAAAPYSAVAPPPAAQGMNYLEVAQKLLFSKDRNPTVVIETPPPKVRPALPLAHGYMNLGEPMILLSEKQGGAQKLYKPGDQIGEFKIVAVDRANLTLEWDGKEFVTPLSEIRPKEMVVQEAAAAPAPAAAAAPAANTLGTAKAGPGASTGGEQRACNPGDNAPSGTVQDGYKKVVKPNPFGSACWWEPVQK